MTSESEGAVTPVAQRLREIRRLHGDCPKARDCKVCWLLDLVATLQQQIAGVQAVIDSMIEWGHTPNMPTIQDVCDWREQLEAALDVKAEAPASVPETQK